VLCFNLSLQVFLYCCTLCIRRINILPLNLYCIKTVNWQIDRGGIAVHQAKIGEFGLGDPPGALKYLRYKNCNASHVYHLAKSDKIWHRQGCGQWTLIPGMW